MLQVKGKRDHKVVTCGNYVTACIESCYAWIVLLNFIIVQKIYLNTSSESDETLCTSHGWICGLFKIEAEFSGV